MAGTGDPLPCLHDCNPFYRGLSDFILSGIRNYSPHGRIRILYHCQSLNAAHPAPGESTIRRCAGNNVGRGHGCDFNIFFSFCYYSAPIFGHGQNLPAGALSRRVTKHTAKIFIFIGCCNANLVFYRIFNYYPKYKENLNWI